MTAVETPLDIVTPVATWENITPERALELLESNTGNRGMRPRAVAAYARDLLEGRWMVTGESVKVDWTGRLIDGQHRLQAIMAAERPVQILVVTGLDPAVQRVIDVNVRRSAADTLKLLGVERNIYEVASAARIALAWESGTMTRYGTLGMSASHAEIYQWVQEHEEIIDAAADARRWFNRLNMPPSPLTFALWQLSKIDADQAQEFFNSTVEYATQGQGDPRAALLRALNNNETRLGRRPATLVGLIFAAWNAWRDNQKVQVLPLVDSKGRALTIQVPV